LHLSALLHVAVLQLHLEILICVILRKLAVSLGHRVFYRTRNLLIPAIK
jgi:hypothetical protein